MNLLVPALVVGLLGLLASCVVLLIWLLTDRSTSPADASFRRSEDATAAQRRNRFRRLGLTAGTVLALVVAVLPSLGRPDLGRALTLAPTAFVATVLVFSCLEALTAPRQAGALRSASLQTRTIPLVVPRALGFGTLTTVILAALTLITGTVLGSPDDLGRQGRVLQTRCVVDGLQQVSARGPWPGSFYVLPISVALIGCFLLAWLTLRAIVVRPARGSDAHDSWSRTQAAHEVLVALALLNLGTTAPLAALMAMAWLGNSCPGYGLPGWLALGVLGVGLAGSAACLVRLLAPARLPRVEERVSAR